jgi:bifunctional polynucleotide phosphatase/kinase
VEALLRRKRSCVVDNTNPDRDKRAKFIAVARAIGVQVRCVEFTTTQAEATFLNDFRHKCGERDLLPHTAFSFYYRLFEAPRKEEGFAEVVRVAPLRDERLPFGDASAESRFQSLQRGQT